CNWYCFPTSTNVSPGRGAQTIISTSRWFAFEPFFFSSKLARLMERARDYRRLAAAPQSLANATLKRVKKPSCSFAEKAGLHMCRRVLLVEEPVQCLLIGCRAQPGRLLNIEAIAC